MFRIRSLAGIALLAASSPVAAADSPPSSRQAIYNEAQAAFDRSDWKGAITGFELIVDPLGSRAANRSEAIIRARLAHAYLQDGRNAAARRSAMIAISALSQTDATELVDAWLTLGDASRFDLAMPAAIDAYRHALSIAPAADATAIRLKAELGIALAAMVNDPGKAAAALDAVLNDQSIIGNLTKSKLAEFEMLRGRAETNRGNFREAVKYLARAVQHSGGLGGTKVSIAQVAIRGDAAIAYKLLGDDEKTREFLAWTGAGHLKSNDWTSGADIALPNCGGAADIRPEDTAVIEFAIDSDGKVVGAAPVYASRPGEMGMEFARAVRRWRWHPDAVAKLDPFWRASIRMQLRCLSTPPLGQVSDSFLAATAVWLLSKGVSDTDIRPLIDGKIAANDPRLLRDDPAAISALIAHMREPSGNRRDPELASRLDQAVAKANGPSEVRALVLLLNSKRDANSLRGQARSVASKLAATVPAFEAAWPQSRAAAWLRLEWALALENAGSLADAKPHLATVLAFPETSLPKTDPIRRLAALHLATLESREGNAAAAQARIAETGLSAEQCSTMDVRPVPTNAQIANSDFPAEALRWQFDGYVREAFDISADGRVRNVRTVLAYPPFVFGEAAEKSISRFRYLPPVIDGAPLGCAGQTQSIRYSMDRSMH